MSRPRRPSRRRGATFTIVAIATSMLLLVSASVFLASTGHTMQRAGFEARRSAAREAAFAAMTWAAKDASAGGRTVGAASLQLDQGITADARYAPAAEGSKDLVVDVTVSPRAGDQPLVIRGTLAARDGVYVLTKY